MQFTNNNYYHAMDDLSSHQVIEPLMPEDEGAVQDALNLGTAEIGTTTNPMANTLQSVKSRIMEGAGRLEFSFLGKGKGNSQSPTPESFGSKERQDMRELLTINDVKASVHASVHTESLAGFGQGGFNGAQREEAMREIRRAVDFAGDVTDGGALVFHMSEWARPMTYAGNRKMKHEKSWMFKGYDTEDTDSQLLVVDTRTGKFIEGIRKDQKVYEPVYKTVGQTNPDLIGTRDKDGHVITKDDWIDIHGNAISRFTSETSRLFERVPEWNENETNFKVNPLNWDAFVDRAKEWNKMNPDKDPLTPEEMYARTQLENNVLQAKGSSLYHAQNYEHFQDRQKKLREALQLYEAYEGELPPEELERMKQLVGREDFTAKDRLLPTEIIKKDLIDAENHMRHIHQSSAAADAQAKQYLEMIEHMDSAEDYGLKKSAEAISRVGLMAMEETKRKGLSKPIYAAPENYDQHLYGSHPDEMRRIIEESRKEMAKQLVKEKRAGSIDQGMKIAQDHIKGTLDIGHMNMWRQYFDPVNEKGESLHKTAEARDKAFEKWLLHETEKLVKAGVVGHIHLADNYGYGDEHLTPGQGNIPMKEFLKKMEKLGMKDMIVEPGSYNPTTSMPDTLAMIGSPIYGVGRLPRFNQVQHQHFGYNAPPFFIGGAYVPSNDWRPWTEVPLE